MNPCTEPVIYDHSRRQPDAFVRLLQSVTAITDREPAESFDDEEVLATGEEFCRRFQERVREASDRR